MKRLKGFGELNKWLLLVLVIALVGGFYPAARAQNSVEIFGQVGLNRIGVGSELGVRFSHQKHSFQLGARSFEPDLVFEKNTLGSSLGYFYSLRNERKMKLNLGLGTSFFFEYKGTTNLFLIDPKILVRPNWSIFNKMSVQLSLGIGPTINHISSDLPINQKNFVYLNYEMAIAVYYRLWNSPKP